jgi:CYTH domain-containing protein
MIVNRGLDEEIDEPRYARIEWERRGLVDVARRPPLDGELMTVIEDRYVGGTRLRLRRMTRPDVDEVKWKLTKKYECADPSARPIVTGYLTEAEYEVLRALPAHELVKRRYHLALGSRYWSLDRFEGPLRGLETIECETADGASLAWLEPPDWALREITHLPQWQCGALACTGAIPEG